jgi:CheY-like chemotaxis protein
MEVGAITRRRSKPSSAIIGMARSVGTIPRATRQSGSDRAEAEQYVLVVQNDAGRRELSQQVLDRCNLASVAVSSGVAAVEVARERAPSLILLDFQLRDVSGNEAIEWLRANPNLRDTPVILFVMSDSDAAGQRHGPDCVLKTPTAPAIEKAVLSLLRPAAPVSKSVGDMELRPRVRRR